MSRLISISWNRLINAKVFWLGFIVTLLISFGITITNAPELAEWVKAGDDVGAESYFYNFAPLIGIVFAAIISLVLGTEYSDGTLRNKLIAGHSRTTVFMAFFIVSFIGCLIITAVWTVSSLPGLHWLDWKFGWDTYLMNSLIFVCSTMAYAAIFTTMSMLIPSKAIGAVAEMFVWFILLFVGSSVVNGMAEEIKVGNQVNGLVIALDHILPSSAPIAMGSDEFAHPMAYVASYLGVAVVVLIAGCMAFKRKDLK